MGSLAKRLGQCSRKSFRSESATLFKNLKANKVPGSLSLELDTTLKDGHDMRVFGLGTMATMSSRAKYYRFLNNMHAVYETIEEELDATTIPAIKSDVIRTVWKNHASILRRKDRYELDMQDVYRLLKSDPTIDDFVATEKSVRVSPKTLKYLKAIRTAGEHDRETGGGLLLGHLYCRYLADLFGGQMLGRPYEYALQLSNPPHHLHFDLKGIKRKAYLEQIYGDINRAGKLLLPSQKEAVRKESLLAFQHNKNVFSEEPQMTIHAIRGGAYLALGWMASFASASVSSKKD